MIPTAQLIRAKEANLRAVFEDWEAAAKQEHRGEGPAGEWFVQASWSLGFALETYLHNLDLAREGKA